MPANITELMNANLGNLSLGNIFSAIVTLILCLLVIRFVMKIAGRILGKSRLDARIQKYVLTGIKTVLYVIAALMVVDSLGIPTTSLVALLSVVSLGVTLAAEDILANLAGGMVILASRPFNIGDFVEASGTSGTVEEISLNFTKLLTPDGHAAQQGSGRFSGHQLHQAWQAPCNPDRHCFLRCSHRNCEEGLQPGSGNDFRHSGRSRSRRLSLQLQGKLH